MNLLLLLALCIQSTLKVDVEPFIAISAKSARVEPLTDSVAVFLTEKSPTEKTGAFLRIASTSKWATPYSKEGILSQSKTVPGTWMFFAPPGKYTILIIEFDPDKGPALSDIEVSIPTSPTGPIPGVGDFTALVKVSKELADKLNDPKTRTALKTAYASLEPILADKSYDDAKNLIVAARFAVFNARQGTSRNVDWDSWRVAVDAELAKVVKPGETAKYIQALKAIVSSL